MKDFKEIIKDIKSVKIQGAENIAKASMKALMNHFSGKKIKTSEAFFKKFNAACSKLESARPTEPLLRNSINFVKITIGKSGTPEELVSKLFSACRQTLYHYETTEEEIFEIGANKIKSGMKIFTHCHSSSVVGVLLKAKEQGKKFEVYNTETRPLFQGRKTVKDMVKAKIPIKHFVDSGANIALKECDLMLIGSDAITSSGHVINKIGSEMFAMVAEKHNVPVYVCADSWKFDPKTVYGADEPIEKRHPKEIWDKAPKKGVTIENMAFERVEPPLIKAVISEFGDVVPEELVHKVRHAYPWMFR